MVSEKQGSLILSWSFEEDPNGILLIGERNQGTVPTIIGCYTGESAQSAVKTLLELLDDKDNAAIAKRGLNNG